jgi:hypothetical protein
MCTHPIDAMGVHLLHYAHDNEYTSTRDVIRNTFVAIARDVGFHVAQKQLHTFSSTTFHSFCQQVDIVFTKNGIHTLVDVVIVDLTQSDLLHRPYATQGFVTSKTT